MERVTLGYSAAKVDSVACWHGMRRLFSSWLPPCVDKICIWPILRNPQKADSGTKEPTGATTAVVADIHERGSSHGVRQTGHCEIQKTLP